MGTLLHNHLRPHDAPGALALPTDRWHDKEGYVGSRKALELVALEPESASETSFVAELPRTIGAS